MIRTAERPLQFTFRVRARRRRPLGAIGTQPGQCPMQSDGSCVLNGQTVSCTLIRECDPYTGAVHFEYAMPQGSPNADVWQLNANGSWSWNDAQSNQQSASYAIAQGYQPPTYTQIVNAGLATPNSSYAAYNPQVDAVTVQAWKPPTETQLEQETAPAETPPSSTSKTSTKTQTKTETAAGDATGGGVEDGDEEVLSTDHPFDWQSLYDSLPEPVRQAWQKASELAPWYVWAAGAAAAIYYVQSRKRRR
jgi:hypothetical protein